MMHWSNLFMICTDDNGREVGRIERIEKPDPINDEFTVTRYSATYFWPSGYRVGANYLTWEEAQAMIEKFAREEQRNELKQAAE